MTGWLIAAWPQTADEVTKNMTKEEYSYYSECRQASFTFRKGSCNSLSPVRLFVPLFH